MGKFGSADIAVTGIADPTVNEFLIRDPLAPPADHLVTHPEQDHAGQKNPEVEADKPGKGDRYHGELLGLPVCLAWEPQRMITRPQVVRSEG